MISRLIRDYGMKFKITKSRNFNEYSKHTYRIFTEYFANSSRTVREQKKKNSGDFFIF